MSELLKTDTVLDKIVARKIEEVEELKASPEKRFQRQSDKKARAGFQESLCDRTRPGRAIIAEIKKASPSAGVIREPFEPEKIAKAYQDNGARAISVITDEKFFQGSLDVLASVRDVTDLPIIRKDFIIDPVQLEDAKTAGADAALLIARILPSDLFQDLWDAARELGLDVLVEIHNERDLEKTMILDPPPGVIGVNNRDLSDFTVSVERTKQLVPLMPEGTLAVSESGLSDPKTLAQLSNEGVGAFLIGTALMRSDDPGAALKILVDGEL